MRLGYCPIGGEPCQSLCADPCSTKTKASLTMEQIESAFAGKVGEWQDSSDRDGYDRALAWFARGARWSEAQEGGST